MLEGQLSCHWLSPQETGRQVGLPVSQRGPVLTYTWAFVSFIRKQAWESCKLQMGEGRVFQSPPTWSNGLAV